jgi:hypothetical protein
MQATRAAFRVSLHKVSIRGNRVSVYAKKQFAKDVEAEIDLPSALEAADFVKGRMLHLTIPQLHILPRMRKVSLCIEGRSYRLVSWDESGAFVAVKDRSA